jgi:hypothetical protein
MIFECLFAFDIAEHAKSRGIKDRVEQLPTWVIVLNCVAVVACLIPFGVLLGVPLGILASVMVQIELNKLAERYGARVG